jgi:hypothetical protein
MTNCKEHICDFCKTGYHAPFDRFDLISTFPDGPTFLRKCNLCGTLWHETLHSARKVTIAEALVLYPAEKISRLI